MRCEVDSCINNSEGYCTCESYISINKDGECDSLEFRTIDLGLKQLKRRVTENERKNCEA